MQPGYRSPGGERPGPEGPRSAVQEPSLPHPPGASGSSACGQSHGSGLLNIPQCSYCTASPSSESVIEIQDEARHVALNTLRLPPTSSPWPAGARAPGLLSPLLPLRAPLQLCWARPGLCQGLLPLSLSAEDPSPIPRARGPEPGTLREIPAGPGPRAVSRCLPPPGMPVRLRVQRRPRAGPVGAPGATAPPPSLLIPFSFFPFCFTRSLRLESHSTVSHPGLIINICNLLHHDCPSGSHLLGTQGHVSGRPLSPPGRAGPATRCWVPGDRGRLWPACRKARGISGMRA